MDRASRSTERQRGLKRTGTRTSDMSRHERRLQQVDDRHDGHSDIDEQRRVRLHQRLVRERNGPARGKIDAMGRARGDYESGQRQEKSTYKKSVQKANVATVWMDATVTRHRVQFGSVRSQCRQTVPRALLPGRCKDRGGRRETTRGRRRRRRRRRRRERTFFVIKRNNAFMCLSTDQLKFLDMTNYLAPGFSYAKYLKAYGCEVTKGHFPYEYMDRLERLNDTVLPPKEAFFSRLKNEGISDEDYVSCQEAWRDNGMSTLRDFLVWYNNRDVVPFLQAVDRQFDFYQQRKIDMFKQGISVPGLTLLYLFNDLPEKTYFTIFNEKHKDLHDLVKDIICGGPSIIFHRYHEKAITTLRRNEWRGVSSVSIDRRIRRERAVSMVAHARHAHGMVHATTL